MFFISALWKPKKHTFINPLIFSRLYNVLVKMYDMRVDLYALSSHKNEYPAHFPTYIRHMGHFQHPCPPACLADRTKTIGQNDTKTNSMTSHHKVVKVSVRLNASGRFRPIGYIFGRNLFPLKVFHYLCHRNR